MLLDVLNPILWVMFIAGPVMIYCGIRGAPRYTGLRYAECGYDLRGHIIDNKLHDLAQTCPECGSALIAPNAEQNDDNTRRPQLIWCGVLMLAIPLLNVLYAITKADWSFLWSLPT